MREDVDVATPVRFLGVWSRHNYDLIVIASFLLLILGGVVLYSLLKIFTCGAVGDTYAALLTFSGTLLGGALGTFFSLAHARLGVVDTISSDILSIGKVLLAADILDAFKKLHEELETQSKEEQSSVPCGFAGVAGKEQYFSVFDASLSNLGSLRSNIVTNVTAFYTFLKAARDATGAMELWDRKGGYRPEMKRADIINVVYLSLLSAYHGRRSLEELYEDEASRISARDEFGLIEQKASGFLKEKLSPLDPRRSRILELRNCCH